MGGFSPHVLRLPQEYLKTGFVIGVNQWPTLHPCDYWIALDTHNWPTLFKDWLTGCNALTFMREKNSRAGEKHVPEDAVDYWFKKADTLQTEWTGRLDWESTTAMAAVNLAIVLGASEVVLYGVDFVGDGRADGGGYSRAGFWDAHREPINRFLARVQQHVPIFKTHSGSWLECPYIDIGVNQWGF